MKPNCYNCVFRDNLPGDAHSKCTNPDAKVTGNAHGIRSGWFMHPINFDPVWLETCDGYSTNKEDIQKAKDPWSDPFAALLGMLR